MGRRTKEVCKPAHTRSKLATMGSTYSNPGAQVKNAPLLTF